MNRVQGAYAFSLFIAMFMLQCCKKNNSITPLKPVVTVFDSVKNMVGTRTWVGIERQDNFKEDSLRGPYREIDSFCDTSLIKIGMLNPSRIFFSFNPSAVDYDTLNFDKYDPLENTLTYSSEQTYTSSHSFLYFSTKITYFFLVDSMSLEYHEAIGAISDADELFLSTLKK
jgi:hypothetical protein